MAKELKVNDRLHTTKGTLTIDNVEKIGEASCHNLIVPDFNTYFVTDKQILVHDIDVPGPDHGHGAGAGREIAVCPAHHTPTVAFRSAEWGARVTACPADAACPISIPRKRGLR